jgi:iron complex outermembrane recepter protein
LEDIPPALIARAELAKGPSSSLYGAGMGGVLKLFPRQYGKGWHIGFSNQVGSFHSYNNNLTTSYTQGRFNIVAGASNAQSDGFRQNSSYFRRSVFIYPSLAYPKLRLNLLVLFSDIKAFIPSSVNRSVFENRPEKADSSWAAVGGNENYQRLVSGINLVYNINSSLYVNSAFFYNSLNDTERRPFNTLEGESYNFGNRSFISWGQSKRMFNLGWEFLLEKGHSALLETLPGGSGGTINTSKDSKSYINVFTMARTKLGNLFDLKVSLNISQMKYKLMDNFAQDSIDFSHDISFPLAISPRAALVYPINAKSKMYASVSHGFSPPSFDEALNPAGLFNKDIKPEQGWMTELGFKGSLLKERVYHEMAVYHFDIHDMVLVERISEEFFINQNAGRAERIGFEGFTRVEMLQAREEKVWEVSAQLQYELSRHRFINFVHEGNDFSGNILPGQPGAQISSGLHLGFHELALGVTHRWIGSIYLNDANEKKQPAYAVGNLDLSYGLVSGKIDIAFTLGVNNVFDKRYASMVLVNAPSFRGKDPRYYYPGRPRFYFLNVDIGLK